MVETPAKFFWLPLWRQYFDDCPELAAEDARERAFADVEQGEAELHSWEIALAEARAGDWEGIDHLVGGEVLPPRSLWPALEVFFADPPPRRRGKKPVIDPTVAASIRYRFELYTTQPMDVVDANDRKIGTNPPMKPMEAYRALASDCALSWETVRDVVKARHTYGGERKTG